MIVKNTTIKLTNTNKQIDKNIMLVNYGELFRLNMSSQQPLVNTDKNIPSVYTKKITIEKIKIKNLKSLMTCYFYRQNYQHFKSVN